MHGDFRFWSPPHPQNRQCWKQYVSHQWELRFESPCCFVPKATLFKRGEGGGDSGKMHDVFADQFYRFRIFSLHRQDKLKICWCVWFIAWGFCYTVTSIFFDLSWWYWAAWFWLGIGYHHRWRTLWFSQEAGNHRFGTLPLVDMCRYVSSKVVTFHGTNRNRCRNRCRNRRSHGTFRYRNRCRNRCRNQYKPSIHSCEVWREHSISTSYGLYGFHNSFYNGFYNGSIVATIVSRLPAAA